MFKYKSGELRAIFFLPHKKHGKKVVSPEPLSNEKEKWGRED